MRRIDVPGSVVSTARRLSLLGVIALVTACSGPPPASALPSTSPVVTLAPTSAAPSATATTAPTTGPTATTAPPATTATATPAATACGVQPDAGRLPSDRLVDVRISQGDGVDLVTFVFGDPSSPAPPAGVASGSIEAVEPPFSAAGSGEPIEVPGEHHVAVRFTGMYLYDDTGAPTYDGPTTFREALPALRAMAQDDAFEGNSGWIIGYDGPGCVTLASGAGTVSVVIEHGPG